MSNKPSTMKEKIGTIVGLSGAAIMVIGIGYLVWRLPSPFGVGVLGGAILFFIRNLNNRMS